MGGRRAGAPVGQRYARHERLGSRSGPSGGRVTKRARAAIYSLCERSAGTTIGGGRGRPQPAMGETRDQLEALSRRDLQALAKARGVRANMKVRGAGPHTPRVLTLMCQSADIIEEILAGASRTADEADAEPAAPAIEAQQAMVASEEGVCERPVEQATVDAAPGSAPAAAVDTLASESAEEEPSPRESVEAGDAGDGREGGEQEEAAVLADEPRADEAAEEDQDGPEVSAAVQSEDVDDEPVDKTGSDAGVVGDPLVYDVAIATYRKIAIEAYEEISPDASQNQGGVRTCCSWARSLISEDDLGADGNTAANVHDAARAPISARKPPNPQPSSAAKAKPKPRFDLQESLKRPIGWEMKRGTCQERARARVSPS